MMVQSVVAVDLADPAFWRRPRPAATGRLPRPAPAGHPGVLRRTRPRLPRAGPPPGSEVGDATPRPTSPLSNRPRASQRQTNTRHDSFLATTHGSSSEYAWPADQTLLSRSCEYALDHERTDDLLGTGFDPLDDDSRAADGGEDDVPHPDALRLRSRRPHHHSPQHGGEHAFHFERGEARSDAASSAAPERKPFEDTGPLLQETLWPERCRLGIEIRSVVHEVCGYGNGGTG